MIRNHFVEHRGSRLHYARAGNGSQHMLVFHGFGQDVSVFDYFTRSLARHYTFYVFDLYFHGSSVWAHDEKVLTKEEWRATLRAFLDQNKIDRFSIGGFSLGGKFVLASLESFASKIDQVFLIAPDGIKTSFWYSLATYPVMLRRLFKSMIFQPERFFSMAEFLAKKGWIDRGLIRFAEYQMNSIEKRKRVYYSWVVFRSLRFNQKKIARLLNDHKIDLLLIVGKYDQVIEPKNMAAFLSRVRHYQYEVIESGHSGLINLSLPYFTEPILKSERDTQR